MMPAKMPKFTKLCAKYYDGEITRLEFWNEFYRIMTDYDFPNDRETTKFAAAILRAQDKII